MLIKELLKLIVEQRDSKPKANQVFIDTVKDKNFAAVRLSGIHYDRGNGSGVLKGSVKTFDTAEKLRSFLLSSSVEGSESRILSFHEMTDSDMLALKWPADIKVAEQDPSLEDIKLFSKLASELSAAEFLKLDCIKTCFLNGDVNEDNYDWLIVVQDGKQLSWFDEVVDFINEAAEDDQHDDD